MLARVLGGSQVATAWGWVPEEDHSSSLGWLALRFGPNYFLPNLLKRGSLVHHNLAHPGHGLSGASDENFECGFSSCFLGFDQEELQQLTGSFLPT